MSPEAEQLIRASWHEMQPQAESIAASFYERLFEIDPQVRALFAATDMEAQQRKFMSMLAELIGVLDDPRRLVAEIAASGQRHVGYGVHDRHYAVVGSALIWALAQGLGERFTPELRDAWRELYAVLAGVMRRAAARATTA